MANFEKQEALTEEKAKAEELLQELLEVVADNFIATYETEGNSFIMRIANGQRFRVSVEEVVR